MTERDSASTADRISQLLRKTRESQAPQALVVGGGHDARAARSAFLREHGFSVIEAETLDAALAAAGESGQLTLMLCDARGPGLSGIEVMERLHKVDADIAVVMLSTINDAGLATDALAAGAMDFLVAPVEPIDMARAVDRAVHRRNLLVEQRNVERLIREEVAARTEELLAERQTLQKMSVSVVEALINAQEAKDLYLRGHAHRVADLAASVASALGLDDELVEDIRLSGRVHDVGKIGIRESVLNKPGPLTPEEFEHVKQSVRISVEIISPLQHLTRILPYIQDHQEHWDGSGYPNGRTGLDISIGGRILHVADAFDAMISPRAFREPRSAQTAIGILGEYAGLQFDPDIFQAFKTVVQRRKSLVFIDVDSLNA